MQPIIKVVRLSYYYDSIPSLDDISFTVDKGIFLESLVQMEQERPLYFSACLG